MKNRHDKIARQTELYIGLMSGTSMDGVDGVLAEFSNPTGVTKIRSLGVINEPFSAPLRDELFALQSAGHNEIHREAVASGELARCYAACVSRILDEYGLKKHEVKAIGVHGQTIRHQPAMGYTRQINNPSMVAELTGIDVIADFRSRDIAAGGQGAPLVPAFHQAIFGSGGKSRVVVNIGGISNISVLGEHDDAIMGFDTGPGNVLLDAWINRHLGKPYDAGGIWGQSGKVIPELLECFFEETYMSLPAPKSTGRDLFNLPWLDSKLQSFASASPADIQATLTEFTASSIAKSIIEASGDVAEVYVCGGGAFNGFLMDRLDDHLNGAGRSVWLSSTDELGVKPNAVEGLAFAWLAKQFNDRMLGSLPSVTGARGGRILGALYPA